MLVSVIVPVYNAGDYVDRCAPSLLEQSLPTDAYEVVYVDDGSTDDSVDRLRRICAHYPHARLLTQENSGWPGKPRNVGIDASRGEYVQFVDQDDELAPEALERLYAMAHRNDSDIVLAKLGGDLAKPVPVFAANVESARLTEIDAIDSLTGHKLFRRAFLDEHDIRFPEGYWRMEDLLFVTRAYANDPRLSVLADYVCYWWRTRDDGANNSLAAFDLTGHYERLRLIIATLREARAPGPETDRLLRRFYWVETLSWVRDAAVLTDPDQTWRTALPLLAGVARDCFPAGVRDGLAPVRQLRGLLAEAEAADELVTLSTRSAGLVPSIRRRDVGIDEDGVLRADLRFSLGWPADAEGAAARPLVLGSSPHGPVLDPRLTAGLGAHDPFLVPDPLLGAHAVVRLEDVERAVWWLPPADLTPALRPADGNEQQVVLAGGQAGARGP